jgi:hypothetical protein
VNESASLAGSRFFLFDVLEKKEPLTDQRLFECGGGGGGNRTLVRKHSTDSSTYLALSFDLTGTTGMCTLRTSELP